VDARLDVDRDRFRWGSTRVLGRGLKGLFLIVLVVTPLAAQSTFYDAYELGLAHERAGRWSAALKAFETAVRLRPEAGRNVPTFGRDTLLIYDPYLHLARVEIELGRNQQALSYLEATRSAGVSPRSEIDSLAASVGEKSIIEETATAVGVTPTRMVVDEPTKTPTRKSKARVPREEARVPPPPTETATSVEEVADGVENDVGSETPVAVAAVTPENESKAGAGILLVVVIGLVVVVLVLRRRRAGRPSVERPEYDTTPTRRVDTSAGAAPDTGSPSVAGLPLIGGYRVLGRLGLGGMATAFRAEQTRDGQAVVLKIPHEHLLDDREFVERFLREGSLGATIHHPNIIRIFEAGTYERTPFIAMELVDGETLESRLARDGALPAAEALEIARGIALALDYAHVKGVVHRDIKPDNVMLLADGSVKVMDFGIARVDAAPGLTATHTYLGTPLYSAPEAIDPGQVGPHSDIYSLGIVLYRMLTNRVPFEAPSPLKVVELHRKAPLPPLAPELGIPAPVEAMVRRLTAKRKEDRYPSAESFLDDLNRYLTGRATNGPSRATDD